MTRPRSVVKRTDRAKRVTARWASKEIYRDGLTYRQWMSAHAKEQRARELARQHDYLKEPDAAAAAKASDDPAPAEPTDRTELAGTGASTDAGGAGTDPVQKTDPAPPAHEDEGRPKERRRSWRRRHHWTA